MECLFRTHLVIEMIDKETGEVVHREVSKSKDYESLVEMLGYTGVNEVESHLSVHVDDVEYGDDGYPKEPDVRTHELSEVAKSVVFEKEEGVSEPDDIFSDMAVPDQEHHEEDVVHTDVIASIDNAVLTEALVVDTTTVNEFGEVSNMSLDASDSDGKEDKQYIVNDVFGEESVEEKPTVESSVDSDFVIGGLDFGNVTEESTVANDTLFVQEADSSSVPADESVNSIVDDSDVEPDIQQPFSNQTEEDDFKTRVNRLDSLFQ